MATLLSKKLRLQPGYKIRVINPPENYRELLAPLPEGIEFVPEGSELDFLHIFAFRKSVLMEEISTHLDSLKYDGILWLSYPKGSARVETDLSRDVFWELLKDQGLRPVTQVSVDEIWSALRFRPQDLVRRKKP